MWHVKKYLFLCFQTRILHRQKFGEFYFRTAVMEYLPAADSQRSKTVASLAVLLEPSNYNLVDLDSVWGGLAVDAGAFANWKPFGPDDFITSGMV